MGSTYARSLTKGASWELVSFILTAIAVYLIYGSISQSLKFAFVISLAKIIPFFIHERIWKKIRWGKIKD